MNDIPNKDREEWKELVTNNDITLDSYLMQIKISEIRNKIKDKTYSIDDAVNCIYDYCVRFKKTEGLLKDLSSIFNKKAEIVETQKTNPKSSLETKFEKIIDFENKIDSITSKDVLLKKGGIKQKSNPTSGLGAKSILEPEPKQISKPELETKPKLEPRLTSTSKPILENSKKLENDLEKEIEMLTRARKLNESKLKKSINHTSNVIDSNKRKTKNKETLFNRLSDYFWEH